MATGDPNAPEGHESGRSGGSNPRDTDQEGDRNKFRGKNKNKKRKNPLTDPVIDGDPLAQGNFGNQSGLGGFRDVIAGDILRRRAARGAQRVKFSETLAETTRRSLFGL